MAKPHEQLDDIKTLRARAEAALTEDESTRLAGDPFPAIDQRLFADQLEQLARLIQAELDGDSQVPVELLHMTVIALCEASSQIIYEHDYAEDMMAEYLESDTHRALTLGESQLDHLRDNAARGGSAPRNVARNRRIVEMLDRYRETNPELSSERLYSIAEQEAEEREWNLSARQIRRIDEAAKDRNRR